MKSKTHWLLVLSLCCLGCSGFIALEVESRPAGASVYVGEDRVGKTPTGMVFYETSEKRVGVTLMTGGYKPLKVMVAVQPKPTKEEAKKNPLRLNLNLKRRRR